MAGQGNEMLSTWAASTREPILDRSIIGTGPPDHGLDGVMRIAKLIAEGSRNNKRIALRFIVGRKNFAPFWKNFAPFGKGHSGSPLLWLLSQTAFGVEG